MTISFGYSNNHMMSNQSTTDATFLNHLGYDLTPTSGPYNEHGKKGPASNYLTSDADDSIYIGYKGFNAHGNLVKSCGDGDFERDHGDGHVVWEMNTAAGNDFIQLREDQNAYTATKLGSGDDTYYIGGALDSNLHAAQHDGDARAYVFGESGDDTIVVGGDGEGCVTGWGVDGGRIFTGSGSDNVTIYGEVDDGGVIDLGSGDTTYANGHEEANSVDLACDVNTLNITKNLGDRGDCDFGIVKGGLGKDYVTIGTTINGISQVELGANNDTLTAKQAGDDSYIDMGTGDDIVDITCNTWDNAHFVLGAGKDVMTVGEDLNDNTLIETGDHCDILNVGEDIEDCSVVDMGKCHDTLNVGRNIEDHSVVKMGSGNDIINVACSIKDSAMVSTGTGNDSVVVDGRVTGHALVDLGSGNNTLEASDGIHCSAVVLAEGGNDVVTAGEDIDGCSKVDLGNGQNIINVAEDVEDKAQLITGCGDDIITVDRFIENCSVTTTGAGDDILSAEGVNNSARIDMGAGNDLVTIHSEFGVGGGSAHVLMGSGDDVVSYGGKCLDGLISGDGGSDTLVLTYDSSDALTTKCCNITNLASNNFTGFEQIDLQGNNVVDICYKDILADTSRDGALYISGDEHSKVDLGTNNWNSDSAHQANLHDGHGASWSETGSTVVDGVTYDIYHHSNAGNNVSNDIYIQEGIVVI